MILIHKDIEILSKIYIQFFVIIEGKNDYYFWLNPVFLLLLEMYLHLAITEM